MRRILVMLAIGCGVFAYHVHGMITDQDPQVEPYVDMPEAVTVCGMGALSLLDSLYAKTQEGWQIELVKPGADTTMERIYGDPFPGHPPFSRQQVIQDRRILWPEE